MRNLWMPSLSMSCMVNARIPSDLRICFSPSSRSRSAMPKAAVAHRRFHEQPERE